MKMHRFMCHTYKFSFMQVTGQRMIYQCKQLGSIGCYSTSSKESSPDLVKFSAFKPQQVRMRLEFTFHISAFLVHVALLFLDPPQAY